MQEDYGTIFPEQEVTYASFWERFAAFFIDLMILMVLNFFISFLFGGGGGGGSVYGSLNGLSYQLGGSFFQLVAAWLYSALQESSAAQATLGKRFMGIRVTDLQGKRISFLRATGRHFAAFISALILLIGYFMMLWEDKDQTLHDKIAGTLVVK